MIRQQRSGIALIIVISLVGLMAITLGYLNHSCRLMMIQTDLVYLKAVERNLTASGVEWVRKQKSEVRIQNSEAQTVALDANEIGGQQARLSVRIEDGNQLQARIVIETAISRGTQEVSRTRTFTSQKKAVQLSSRGAAGVKKRG